VPEDMLDDMLDAQATLLESIHDNKKRLDALLGRIDRAVGRGVQVTNVILAYSRLGREQRGNLVVLLRPLVESILAEEAEDFAAHGIVVQIGIAKDYALRGNAMHFASMLRHLIQNSREALVSQPDPGLRELRIEGVEDPERWVLRVSDTGVGIAPDDRDKIFIPFFSTRPPEGMGLGLSMVQKLVRLYQGSICFESEEGRGATFIIALPNPSAIAIRDAERIEAANALLRE
jgi:signal transduction histidine kinase